MRDAYPFHRTIAATPAFAGSTHGKHGHSNFYGMDPYDTHGKRAMRERVYRQGLNAPRPWIVTGRYGV